MNIPITHPYEGSFGESAINAVTAPTAWERNPHVEVTEPGFAGIRYVITSNVWGTVLPLCR